MAEIIDSEMIKGVKFVYPRAFGDDRGRFMETFRTEWFPERSWNIVQTNRSDSRTGVLRGLHYHLHQVDYWYVPCGRIRVGLADIRQGSPTYGRVETIEIGDKNQVGVFIPCGVAHGFLALTDSTLTYLVDQYYNADDELGIVWNDPVLNIQWGTDVAILSPRDMANPPLSNIVGDLVPAYADFSLSRA